MWTPRRVLLLLLGVCVFGFAYGVYERFLGGIDGLPQLPGELLARRLDTDEFKPPTQTITDRKLILAFGENCEEVGYNFKVELPAKGIVIATNQYDIDADGRLKLTPFSLATLKERTPGDHPEINSIHCDVGFLEFDKPVKTLQEMGSRRIVACELIGDPGLLANDPRRGWIHLVNNRGTPAPDDDLVLVTSGPVSFREAAQPGLPIEKALPEIRTSAAVQIVDRRNQPHSTTVTAQGMQVYLATESPSDEARRRAATSRSTITGVRRVVLPANVNMNLWIDSGSGFMAGSGKPADGAAKSERTNLQITTIGPFTYDLLPEGDRARFDCLPRSATTLPNSVRVVRPQVRGAGSVVNDQLECDHLELKFAPRKGSAAAMDKHSASTKGHSETEHSQIEWIHAQGQCVVLTSDEEKLEARGSDLFHDAIAKTTTLTGSPETVALKEGNEIHAPVLVIFNGDAKQGQHAEARGAGYFRMLDRAGSQRTVTARWKEKLIYQKEQSRDLLTLIGDAAFEDKAGGQSLTANTLKLTLAPDSTNAVVKPATGTTSRPRPQQLEAYGHVYARAPEMSIRDTEELIVLFKDAPALNKPLAPSAGPAAPGAPAGQPTPAAPQATGAKPTPPKNPVDLRARRVQAFLLVRPGDQTDLDNVHCEGSVHVHQAPAPPQTKPIDMAGDRLDLKHTAEGNILEVKGTLQSPGQVSLPDLELLGPYIKIDQVENVAEVLGIGSMQIQSQTDLQGKKLEKPTPLRVFWKQKMRFNGQMALFHGHVQADQADTSLLCNNMQVFLNRPVSLNQQTGQPRPPESSAANVDKVICDNQGQELPQPVTITESVTSADGKLLRYQRIETDTVAMHREEGSMEAGPGSVRILQPGPKDAAGPFANPKPRSKLTSSQKPEEEYKLTWIQYTRALRLDNPRRTATFYGNIEVLHLPSNDPGLRLTFSKLVDRLPPGAVYLRCERLDVYSTKDAQGHTQQEFTAKDRAEVQASEFYGRANVIKYDEAKQQLIFEGGDQVLAELYYAIVQGQEPKKVKGSKIVYNRLTQEATVSEARVITSDGIPRR